MKKKSIKEENPEISMKDRIIEESIKFFLKKSFKGTSIQDITDTLGITKGAFYWHFKSKDELLETIIEKYDEELFEKLYTYMKDFKSDFIKKFRVYHKYINEYAKSNSEISILFVTLAAEMAGSGTSAEKRIKDVYNKYLNFIVSLLRLGKNEGFFRPEYNVNLNAHIIIAIHNGIFLQWYMNRKDLDGPSMARTYRDIILYGMIKDDIGKDIKGT
jgi:AcrR family transcriptional regulator